MGRVGIIVKRIVLGAFVAAAVVCGGSKGPQSAPPMVGRVALNAPQTDAGRPDPSRWTAIVGYSSSEASPQSGCPSRGAIALNRPNAPQTVAAEDIARGYRFVGEATEDIVYTMPEDGVKVGNWGRRGTFGEWLRYELGWNFPLGSNDTSYSAFAVFSDGRIRPTPRDRSHEICAVGVPMLAMQGASRFWVADGSDGETALTWENFFLNADTNQPINAQIVLYENGDFVTRSNEVARYYARIDPHDWDGDGLANEIDDEPYTNNGDCFGTGEGWWAANAAAVAATNANPAAYYWLEFAATKDKTHVTVTCDGASDLGDMVVIARTNQVCRVPLLIGATYAVRASAPLTGIVTSDDNAEVTFNDDISVSAARSVSEPYQGDWGQSHPSSDFASQSSSLRSSGDTVPLRPLYQSGPTNAAMQRVEGNRPYRAVAWGRASADFDVYCPLGFSLEQVDERSWRLVTSPTDVGAEILSVVGSCCAVATNAEGFVWNCRGGCDCGGYDQLLEVAARWCGYTGRFEQWLGCGCPMVGGEEPDPSDEASVALAFSRAVAFCEAVYTNAEGEAVLPNASNVVMTCTAYGGARGGRLSVSVNDGGRVFYVSGNNPATARAVAPGQSVRVRTVYKPLQNSLWEGDVTATATFRENLWGHTLTAGDALTVVGLSARAVATNPVNRTRREMGVGELVDVYAEPMLDGMAAASSRGACPRVGGDHFRYGCAHVGGEEGVTVTAGGSSHTMRFDVLEPTGYEVFQIETNVTAATGQAGGFEMTFRMWLQPRSVSFERVDTIELPRVATNAIGYFAQPDMEDIWDHGTHGAGHWEDVGKGNVCGDATGVEIFPPPWDNGGSFTWPIPNAWRVRGDVATTNIFCNTDQRFAISSDGTVTLEKFGYTGTRSTNGLFKVTGENLP